MSSWRFSCEWKPEIPLPPEYSFPQAFNYLNPETNSFYILESPKGDYIQCGGSKERCTVEVRRFHDRGYTHYVLGRPSGSHRLTSVAMSNVGVKVQENEVFQHSDAIELFKRFFAGDDFPDDSDNTTAHKTLDRMTRSAVGRMFQIEQSLARSSSSVSFADRYASELSALAEAIDLAVGALAPWSCTETPTLEISSQPSFSP